MRRRGTTSGARTERRSPGRRSRGRRGHRRDRQPHHPVRRVPDPGGREAGTRPHLRDRPELRQGRPRAPPRERRRPGEGHRHQGGRQDRPLDQGAAGPRAHAPAPRLGPGLRAPPEEVHAPERGAPGRLQALRRAQAQVAPRLWASSAGATSGSSPNSSAAHPPSRSPSSRVARAGIRSSSATRPSTSDGDPFPTHVLAHVPRRRSSRLAAGGGGLDLEAERAVRAPSPAFADAVARAHAEYARERARDDPERRAHGAASAGPGDGLKCLHAHYAHHLAGGDDVGRRVGGRATVEPDPRRAARAAWPRWTRGRTRPACSSPSRTEGGGFEELARDMVITRLGQGVDATGRLAPDALERTLEVIARYVRRARALHVERIRVGATAAVRDASNARRVRTPGRASSPDPRPRSSAGTRRRGSRSSAPPGAWTPRRPSSCSTSAAARPSSSSGRSARPPRSRRRWGASG